MHAVDQKEKWFAGKKWKHIMHVCYI